MIVTSPSAWWFQEVLGRSYNRTGRKVFQCRWKILEGSKAVGLGGMTRIAGFSPECQVGQLQFLDQLALSGNIPFLRRRNAPLAVNQAESEENQQSELYSKKPRNSAHCSWSSSCRVT